MDLKYIDIHCHLPARHGFAVGESGGDLLKPEDCLDAVISRMKEREVGAITIGTDLESAKRAVKIAEENENVWACIGVHPDEVSSPDQGEGRVWFSEAEFEKIVTHPKVVAIGECGLDFFRLNPEEFERERERQEILFRKQIEFALKHNKPLMLHCRDSYDEVLAILESYNDKKLRGNAHFFAGSLEQAKSFFDLGFTISFTGVITFPPRRSSTEASTDPLQVLKEVSLDKIMSETDSPFVAPVPYRGKRNEPTFVIEVVKKIAEIRGEDEESVRLAVLSNANRMFGLK